MSLEGTISSITRVNYRSRCGVINESFSYCAIQETANSSINYPRKHHYYGTKMRNNITSAPCHPWLRGLRMSRTSCVIVTGNQSSQENPKLCVLSCVCVLFAFAVEIFNVVAMTELNLIWTPRSISIQSAVCQNLAKIARVMLRRILGLYFS